MALQKQESSFLGHTLVPTREDCLELGFWRNRTECIEKNGLRASLSQENAGSYLAHICDFGASFSFLTSSSKTHESHNRHPHHSSWSACSYGTKFAVCQDFKVVFLLFALQLPSAIAVMLRCIISCSQPMTGYRPVAVWQWEAGMDGVK